MDNAERNDGWAEVIGGVVTAVVVTGMAAAVALMTLGRGQAEGAIGGILEFPSPRTAATISPQAELAPVAMADSADAPVTGQLRQEPSRQATAQQPQPQARPMRTPPAQTWAAPAEQAHQPGPPTPPEVDLNDPGYRRAAEAAVHSPPTAAVVIIEDFRAQHRDPLWEPHLDRLLDTAMDRLWWQRVSELIRQRQEVSRQINELRVEQARTNDAAQRRRQTERIESLRQRLDRVATELRDMKYTATEAPDRMNAQQLDAIRQQRDPAAFAIWKARVRTTLLRTRGVPPWEL